MRFWGQNDKNSNNLSVTPDVTLVIGSKYYRLMEILWREFIFIQCEFIELSKLAFVANGNIFTTHQKLSQVLFRSLHPSAKSQLQGFHETCIV